MVNNLTAMAKVKVGLEVLRDDPQKHPLLQGRVGYLCHQASLTSDFEFGFFCLKNILGKRLVKLFGPQHGLVCNVQDNMIETDSFHHPYFDLPVYSLYGDTRSPTDEMLAGLDTVVVDLQDVGTRVYTYSSTLVLLLRACAAKGIGVVVLDRPNPTGGTIIEGNLLDKKWHSFVGTLEIPMRHAMTLGELGAYAIKVEQLDLNYHVIPVSGLRREFFWRDTRLPWVNPSPNLSTPESSLTFCGTVLFEGTTVSEGRGTTRALEILGVPGIEPYKWWEELAAEFQEWGFEGVVLRPTIFRPTFQKHRAKDCGGFQIHVTDPKKFLSWRLGQWLLKCFCQKLGKDFKWSEPPYEYQYENLPIDYINGTDGLRAWVQSSGEKNALLEWEQQGRDQFLKHRRECLLYR